MVDDHSATLAEIPPPGVSSSPSAPSPAAPIRTEPLPTEMRTPARMPAAEINPLWTAQDVAAYLQLSAKKVRAAARTPATETGSIPNMRLPGGEWRFIPEDVKAWAAAGFPPAATFKAWKELAARRTKKAG